MTSRDLPFYEGFTHPVYGVIDFVGETFTLGAAGGAAFHFVRGLVLDRGSPGGRLAAGIRAARANAPRIAGRFGAVCAVFSVLESAAYLARGGEPSFAGGAAAAAAAFGLHGMRRGGGGPGAARGAFLGGACILVIEGLYRAQMVSESEASLARQKRINGDRPAPAALRLLKPPDDAAI